MAEIVSVLLFVLILNLADVILAQNLQIVLNNRPIGEEFHNTITLRCRDLSSSTDDGDALFWLNRASSLDPSIAEREDINHSPWNGEFNQVGIQFIITQRLEGHYTCGRRITSGGDTSVVESGNNITLVALPVQIPDLEVTARTEFFSTVGETAIIVCPVKPGNLKAAYFVSWKLSGTVIARYPDSGGIPSSKYGIDEENFSLMISNVDGADASSQYTCEIGVRNAGQDFPYRQASNIMLTLTVDAPPVIISGPEPQIVSMLKENATCTDAGMFEPTQIVPKNASFTCTAAGIPEPSIMWYHKGNLAEIGDKYVISIMVGNSTSADGRITIRSELIISTIQNSDNGEVICNVSNNSELKRTTLSVLGCPDRRRVIITTEKDVILELAFPNVIPATMQLKITYTDCNNDETLTSIQAEKYANVKLIRYDARSSDVPECFAVAVNIIAGETRVMGPLITFSGTHNKTDPTVVCPPQPVTPTICEAITTGTIAAAAVACFFGLVTLAGICMCCIGCYISKQNKRKERERHEAEIRQRESEKEEIQERVRQERLNLAKIAAEKENPEEYANKLLRCYEIFKKMPQSDSPSDDGDDRNEQASAYVKIFERITVAALSYERVGKEYRGKFVSLLKEDQGDTENAITTESEQKEITEEPEQDTTTTDLGEEADTFM